MRLHMCLCCLEREGVVRRGVLRYLRLQWLCKPNSTHGWGWEERGRHCYTQSVLTDGRDESEGRAAAFHPSLFFSPPRSSRRLLGITCVPANLISQSSVNLQHHISVRKAQTATKHSLFSFFLEPRSHTHWNEAEPHRGTGVIWGNSDTVMALRPEDRQRLDQY